MGESADNVVRLVIKGDESGAVASMQKYREGLRTMETETSGMMSSIKTHWLAATVGITAAMVMLKQAWDIVDVASQFEEQKDSLNRLAAQYNTTADSIISDIQRMSKGMISQADAVSISAQGLMKGMDPGQMAKLSEAAETLSNVSGRKVVDIMKELSESLETGKMKALKMQLGIVDLDAIYGNAASTMSDTEKAQAMYNIVIEKTTALQKIMGDQTESTNDKMEKMSVQMQDLKLTLGEWLMRAALGSASALTGLAGAFLLAGAGVIKLSEGLNWLMSKVTFGNMSKYFADLKNQAKEAAEVNFEYARKMFEKSGELWSGATASTETSSKATSTPKIDLAVNLKKEQDALLKSLKERLPLYEKYYTDLKKLQEDYKQAIEKSLKEIADIDKKILESRKAIQDALYEVNQKANPAANEMEEYNRKSAKLEQDKSYAMSLSGEERVKALQEYARAWKDMVKQIDYTDIERTLDTSGGLGSSAEFKSVEVKKTWLSLGDSAKTASQRITEAGNMIEQTQQEMRAAAETQLSAQTAAFNNLTASVNTADEWMKYLKRTIEDLDKGLLNPRTFTLDTSSALAGLQQVQDKMNQISAATGVAGNNTQITGIGGEQRNSNGIIDYYSQGIYNTTKTNWDGSPQVTYSGGGSGFSQGAEDIWQANILDTFASGTPYVPRTGLYQLHQGERVVPASENKPNQSSAPVSISIGDIIIQGASGNTAQMAKVLRSDIERELARLKTYRS